MHLLRDVLAVSLLIADAGNTERFGYEACPGQILLTHIDTKNLPHPEPVHRERIETLMAAHVDGPDPAETPPEMALYDALNQILTGAKNGTDVRRNRGGCYHPAAQIKVIEPWAKFGDSAL